MYLVNQYAVNLKKIIKKPQEDATYGDFYYMKDEGDIEKVDNTVDRNLTVGCEKSKVEYIGQYVDGVYSINFSDHSDLDPTKSFYMKLPINTLGIQEQSGILGIQILGIKYLDDHAQGRTRFTCDNNIISATKIFVYENAIHFDMSELKEHTMRELNHSKLVIKVTYLR